MLVIDGSLTLHRDGAEAVQYEGDFSCREQFMYSATRRINETLMRENGLNTDDCGSFAALYRASEPYWGSLASGVSVDLAFTTNFCFDADLVSELLAPVYPTVVITSDAVSRMWFGRPAISITTCVTAPVNDFSSVPAWWWAVAFARCSAMIGADARDHTAVQILSHSAASSVWYYGTDASHAARVWDMRERGEAAPEDGFYMLRNAAGPVAAHRRRG